MSKTQIIVLGSCVLATAAILASAPAGEQTGPAAAPAPASRPYSRPRHRSMRLPSHKPLSQEEIDEIMAFMKEHAPAVHERLTTLLEENPRLAQRLLRRMQWLYQRVRAYPPEVRAAAVKRHMLNPSIFKTLAELRRTTDAKEKERLAARLRELLAQRFDNDQIVKEYEVVCLEKRLAELKAEIKRRRENRKELIDERMKAMLGAPPDKPARVPRPHR